jgi:hypothetical protein
MLAARYSSRSSGSAPWASVVQGQLRVLGLEGVRDVLQEDQAEHDVLVFGRIHVVAQGVGHLPELGFVAEGLRHVHPTHVFMELDRSKGNQWAAPTTTPNLRLHVLIELH